MTGRVRRLQAGTTHPGKGHPPRPCLRGHSWAHWVPWRSEWCHSRGTCWKCALWDAGESCAGRCQPRGHGFVGGSGCCWLPCAAGSPRRPQQRLGLTEPLRLVPGPARALQSQTLASSASLHCPLLPRAWVPAGVGGGIFKRPIFSFTEEAERVFLNLRSRNSTAGTAGYYYFYYLLCFVDISSLGSQGQKATNPGRTLSLTMLASGGSRACTMDCAHRGLWGNPGGGGGPGPQTRRRMFG